MPTCHDCKKIRFWGKEKVPHCDFNFTCIEYIVDTRNCSTFQPKEKEHDDSNTADTV